MVLYSCDTSTYKTLDDFRITRVKSNFSSSTVHIFLNPNKLLLSFSIYLLFSFPYNEEKPLGLITRAYQKHISLGIFLISIYYD